MAISTALLVLLMVNGTVKAKKADVSICKSSLYNPILDPFCVLLFPYFDLTDFSLTDYIEEHRFYFSVSTAASASHFFLSESLQRIFKFIFLQKSVTSVSHFFSQTTQKTQSLSLPTLHPLYFMLPPSVSPRKAALKPTSTPLLSHSEFWISIMSRHLIEGNF